MQTLFASASHEEFLTHWGVFDGLTENSCSRKEVRHYRGKATAIPERTELEKLFDKGLLEGIDC